MDYGLCIEMAFADQPFDVRLEKAAALGFKNVEMWFVDMSYQDTPEKLKTLAEKYKLNITNTVIDAPDGSIAGGLTDPSKRASWLERARTTLDFNKRAGIPRTIVCTGNRIEGMSDDEMMKSVLEGLVPTLQMAEEYGVTLLLEPLNDRHDHPGCFITSSDVGSELCRTLKSDRMKMLFDCYHMQCMEGDVLTHIEKNLDVIGHFHSAGVPGRHELYNSELDYPYVIREIEKMGYDGVFGFEYEPGEGMDHTESVQRVLDHLPPQS